MYFYVKKSATVRLHVAYVGSGYYPLTMDLKQIPPPLDIPAGDGCVGQNPILGTLTFGKCEF